MNKPLVSVVIATYNMGCYLPFAIRSALDQTYRNMEILVVDDGSTDDTSHTIEPFLDDSRVRYYVQRNRGQAAAKNHGLSRSEGEYVAFLDADDMWAPEKLDLQISVFAKSEALGVVYSRFAYIDENGKEKGLVDGELFRGRISGPLLIRNFIAFGTSVTKKECFERLGGFKEDMRMGIDYDLWLRFSTRYEFDYVDRPLLYYRIWPGQMSKNVKTRYLNGIQTMKNFLREFPGVVDKRTEREAWAHTYVGFGQCLLDIDQSLSAALNLYMRALCYSPGYLPAWKAMIKAMCRRIKLT